MEDAIDLLDPSELAELDELEALAGGPAGLQQGPIGVGVEGPVPLRRGLVRKPLTPDEVIELLWPPEVLKKLRQRADAHTTNSTRMTKRKKVSRRLSILI